MPTTQVGSTVRSESDADTAAFVVALTTTGASVGEHWVVELMHDSNDTRTWPTGWTQIHVVNGTAANNMSSESRFTLISAGNVGDSTMTITPSGSESYVAFATRYEGMTSATGLGTGTVSTANPNPPLVSAAGWQATYARSGIGVKRGTGTISATPPTGFALEDQVVTGGSNGMGGATSDDTITSASSLDPGTWGHGLGGRQTHAWTILFEDAEATTPPVVAGERRLFTLVGVGR